MGSEAFWLIRGGALGDALLAYPALWRLKAAHPKAKLALASSGALRGLLAPYVDLYLTLDDFGVGLFLQGSPEPDGWVPGCRVALWMADPSGTARRNLARWGASEVVHLWHLRPGQHAALQLQLSIDHWGLAQDKVPLLATGPAQTVNRDLQPDVLIHPGSGSTAKNWPLQAFISLAVELRRKGLKVAFLAGPAEEAVGIARQLALGGQEVISGLSVGQVARLLSTVKLYVGNDSGITHLAGLVGAATLAIFGPTDPTVWAPLGPRVQVIACGKDMWPALDQVLEAVDGMLQP